MYIYIHPWRPNRIASEAETPVASDRHRLLFRPLGHLPSHCQARPGGMVADARRIPTRHDALDAAATHVQWQHLIGALWTRPAVLLIVAEHRLAWLGPACCPQTALQGLALR